MTGYDLTRWTLRNLLGQYGDEQAAAIEAERQDDERTAREHSRNMDAIYAEIERRCTHPSPAPVS